MGFLKHSSEWCSCFHSEVSWHSPFTYLLSLSVPIIEDCCKQSKMKMSKLHLLLSLYPGYILYAGEIKNWAEFLSHYCYCNENDKLVQINPVQATSDKIAIALNAMSNSNPILWIPWCHYLYCTVMKLLLVSKDTVNMLPDDFPRIMWYFTYDLIFNSKPHGLLVILLRDGEMKMAQCCGTPLQQNQVLRVSRWTDSYLLWGIVARRKYMWSIKEIFDMISPSYIVLF